jgi:hypothetical protein
MDNINMINNITPNTPGSGLEPSKKTDPTGPEPTDTSDATVRSEYASIINKALETEELDLLAVQKAKEALDAGLIDTPENVRDAADNILRYGI